MIIVPEIETVFILVPRCASTSIRTAVLDTYESAMPVFRHMEADGVPHGYDRWDKVGIVRDPVYRLFSLYKYLHNLDPESSGYPDWTKRVKEQVEGKSFLEWLRTNESVFSSPYDGNKYYPYYSVKHPLPENRKSQWEYLRPDLGTKVYPFTDLAQFEKDYGLTLCRSNKSGGATRPDYSQELRDHIVRYFEWDIKMYNKLTRR